MNGYTGAISGGQVAGVGTIVATEPQMPAAPLPFQTAA